MTQSFNLDYLGKTLEQFDSHPYPNIPIEESPKNNLKLLYDGSFVTARYRRDKMVITDLENRLMLDIACGTGATTLTMALANPGATIIAVDISAESLKIAEQRLTYHGFDNVTYHVLSLEEIDQLGLKFDYINASDILYLLPNISLALQQLGKVLKPNGILRGNLHSYYQRFDYYRAQALFQRMGLMDENPGEIEIGIVRELFDALQDTTLLKSRVWSQSRPEDIPDETILANHLLQNDKGSTMPQLLEFLDGANLELLSMVNWWEWQLTDLFKQPEDLPAFLALSLPELSYTEQLCLYELIHPNKRLLDFWCGHPQNSEQSSSQSSNLETNENWQNIRVYLHPCLKTETFIQEILSDTHFFPLNLKQYFHFLNQQILVDRSLFTALFVPLLDQPQTMDTLVKRWLKIRPVNPVTLAPTTEAEAFGAVSQAIVEQEKLGIFLLEG